MVSAVLEVVAACCLCHYKSKLSTHRSSDTDFSQDETVPLYKIVLAWLEHYSSQLIQLVYHFCFPVDPNNTYKLNQSRTPPKLTFFENVLVNMFTMILVTVQRLSSFPASTDLSVACSTLPFSFQFFVHVQRKPGMRLGRCMTVAPH